MEPAERTGRLCETEFLGLKNNNSPGDLSSQTYHRCLYLQEPPFPVYPKIKKIYIKWQLSFTNIFTTSCLQIFRYIQPSWWSPYKFLAYMVGMMVILSQCILSDKCLLGKIDQPDKRVQLFSFHHNLYMKKIDSIHMSYFFFLFPFPLFFITIDLCSLKRLKNQANNWNINFLQFIIIWVSL